MRIKIKNEKIKRLFSENTYKRNKNHIVVMCNDTKGIIEKRRNSIVSLVNEVFEIILKENKDNDFSIHQIKIHLSLFEKPYVYVWLDDFGYEMNKIYKEQDSFHGAVNPTFKPFGTSQYEGFILDFKPF